MESLTTLQIIGIIVLILVFGGVIWRIAKRLFAVLVIAVLVLLGIYFTNPEILYEWFGKSNVQKIEVKVKEGGEELKEVTNDVGNKVGESVD